MPGGPIAGPALFRLLVESVTDYAIFLLDPQGRVMSWNPGAAQLEGYSDVEVIGRHFSIFHTEEDVRAGLPERELELAAREGRCEAEGWRVRKDGSRFWANAIVSALRDDHGSLIGYAKITRDLTERREAEERARHLAAERAAREEAERRGEELAELSDQLQQQALELESQTEEAQTLTEELEQSNQELQSALEIAERARAEAAEHERFANGILASITDPFIVTDAHWRIRYLNESASTLLEERQGKKATTALGELFWDVYDGLSGTGFERVLRRAEKDRTPAMVEEYVPDRGEWWVLSCYPLPDGGLATQWRDVSDQKRAEEATRYLANAGEVLGSSLDYEVTLNELASLVVPDLADWCGVSIVDETGAIKQVAVAHVDPAKTRYARELNERYPPHPDDPTGVPNVIRTGKPELYPDISDELLVAGAKDEEHLRIIRELGLRSAMSVPLIARDHVVGALSLVSAESKRRYTSADLALASELANRAALAVDNARLHRAAQEARTMAESANQAKTQFLAVMSHELRTPLNAIGGYAELLRMGLRGPLTPDQDQDLDRIQRNQHALLALINDILNYARLESGHVEYAVTPVPVRALVADIESMVHPQLAAKQLHFDFTGCDEGLAVQADEEKVRQILVNLLSNAIKFTDRGSIGVDCRANDANVDIVVCDTGAGIPADKLQTIFEPFVQLDRTLSTAREGSGLGLAISRDLARGMGGELTAASTPGAGSVFTLTLPRATG